MREKRIRRRAAVLAVSTSLLAIAALPAIPAGAGAATTIGSNLAAAPTVDLHCLIPHGCTLGQRVLPPTSQAPGGVFAPHDGVVVRWRIKVGIVGIQTVEPALVITRPGSSDTRAGVGTGPQVITPTDQTSTYDVRIPIQAGDALALFCCTTNDAFGPGQYVQAASPGAVSVLWRPEDQLGSGRAGYQLQDQELLINADIEPDCDGDGLGDESQDTSTSPCPTCKGQPATIIGTSGDDVRIALPVGT